MSIRGQIEDAIFLADNKRYTGALTILMLAIAASSKKVFPPGTKSIANPKVKMPDQESFSLFLGGRLQEVLFGFRGGFDIGNSGIALNFRGESTDLAVLIYKYYRNSLIHQGILENDVEFINDVEGGENFGTGLNVNIAASGRLCLEPKWLHIFIEAVMYAVCNASEFGIVHRRLVVLNGDDEKEIIGIFTEKFSIAVARYLFFKHLVEMLWEVIQVGTDEKINHEFAKLVPSGKMKSGGVSLLRRDGFADDNGYLSPRGIACIRDISTKYDLKIYS